MKAHGRPRSRRPDRVRQSQSSSNDSLRCEPAAEPARPRCRAAEAESGEFERAAAQSVERKENRTVSALFVRLHLCAVERPVGKPEARRSAPLLARWIEPIAIKLAERLRRRFDLGRTANQRDTALQPLAWNPPLSFAESRALYILGDKHHRIAIAGRTRLEAKAQLLVEVQTRRRGLDLADEKPSIDGHPSIHSAAVHSAGTIVIDKTLDAHAKAGETLIELLRVSLKLPKTDTHSKHSLAGSNIMRQ